MASKNDNGPWDGVVIASRDIRVGDKVSEKNAASGRRPAAGVDAIAGEDIRRGERILFVPPFAWSASS